MTALEEAINELGRQSWASISVLGRDSDYVTKDIVEHMETCPLKAQFQALAQAAIKVKAEWHKTSKRTKDILFACALEDKKEQKNG
jgi:hypothetical protein